MSCGGVVVWLFSTIATSPYCHTTIPHKGLFHYYLLVAYNVDALGLSIYLAALEVVDGGIA